jgi:hypothetical protein
MARTPKWIRKNPVITQARRRLETANPHLDPCGIRGVLVGEYRHWMDADDLVERSMRRWIPSRASQASRRPCGRVYLGEDLPF